MAKLNVYVIEGQTKELIESLNRHYDADPTLFNVSLLDEAFFDQTVDKEYKGIGAKPAKRKLFHKRIDPTEQIRGRYIKAFLLVVLKLTQSYEINIAFENKMIRNPFPEQIEQWFLDYQYGSRKTLTVYVDPYNTAVAKILIDLDSFEMKVWTRKIDDLDDNESVNQNLRIYIDNVEGVKNVFDFLDTFFEVYSSLFLSFEYKDKGIESSNEFDV